MSNQSILEELVRRQTRVEEIVSQNSRRQKKFEILNIFTPPAFTADQDDYVPGDYDVLLISTDTSRNLSGISGGVTGRLLRLLIIGSNNLVVLQNSGSSISVNRIQTPTGADLTLTPYASAELIYTGADWQVVSFRM